jgi:hypothetical protein
MNQEDQERVDRALDLLKSDKVDVDPEALKARIPDIMKKANERADEILRAKNEARTGHRTRNLVTLVFLLLVTVGAIAAAHFLNQPTEAQKRERAEVEALLVTLKAPTLGNKALAEQIYQETRERLDRGDDIALVHSQLVSDMERLKR